MARIEIDYPDRQSWLAARVNGIGASEAAALMGVSPWMSRDKLFQIKTGAVKPKDRDNAAKRRGRELEGALSGLFFANHPEFKSTYRPYTIVAQEERPWLFATLDGEMSTVDVNHLDMVLEIKTAELWSAAKWAEWDNQIPAAYYMQVLHQMLATGCKKVYLFAYLIGKEESIVREYVFDRADRDDDCQILLAEEIKFWASVEEAKRNAVQG